MFANGMTTGRFAVHGTVHLTLGVSVIFVPGIPDILYLWVPLYIGTQYGLYSSDQASFCCEIHFGTLDLPHPTTTWKLKHLKFCCANLDMYFPKLCDNLGQCVGCAVQ